MTRNKLRSFLTILSVAFSVALMTVLYGFLVVQDVTEREANRHDRVVVLNKLGFGAPLPITQMEKMKKMDGVESVTPFCWYGGNYKSEQATFALFGVDPEVMFDIYAEFEIPEDQLAEFKGSKNACVVEDKLAETMNWKVGDRVPMEGSIYQASLDLVIVGIYSAPVKTGEIYFNWYYLDDLLEQQQTGFRGNAGTYTVKCKAKDEVVPMCARIDSAFANSENPTKTRTEAAFLKMFADMLGDVQTFVRYISMAVVFALTLVTATAMAMSMRERITEVAVLKAIGFSNKRVLAMVLGESILIASLGGMFGILLGLKMLQSASSIPATENVFPFPVSQLIGPWLIGIVLVAGLIGFVSGLVPAIRAARLSVVDGLRQVV